MSAKSLTEIEAGARQVSIERVLIVSERLDLPLSRGLEAMNLVV